MASIGAHCYCKHRTLYEANKQKQERYKYKDITNRYIKERHHLLISFIIINLNVPFILTFICTALPECLPHSVRRIFCEQ